MIELEFKQRPIDVPSDLRLYNRLAMLTISMSECCRGSTASLRQLHFLNSLYRDDKFRSLYLEFKSKKFSLKILSPSADPYLNRCINYAIGAGLVEQKKVQNGFRLTLSEKGKGFVKDLKKQKLAEGIFFLSKTFGKIPETEIEDALRIEK